MAYADINKCIEELEKETLKYKIIKKFFPQIKKEKIKEYQLFLPIKFKIDKNEHTDIFFSEYVDKPSIVKKTTYLLETAKEDK